MDKEILVQFGERACRHAENLTLPKELRGIFFCAASYREGIATQVFVAISFVLLMATAIIGNSVVMWIIYKHKVMHYGFNYFLFNMAFADLLIALFNVGTSWTYNLYYDWWLVIPHKKHSKCKVSRYGDLCTLTSFFGIAPTTVSVCSMMALSWDRCQAVVNPLQKRPLSRKRSVTAILVIWVLSTVTALPFAISASVSD
uniref:G_PROTEIN_RECEP_F1_2 domain-containing protein n=1 Tax=Caenorhabditis japonica TaxID=281687 RepID=A0A8R1HK68_CAEJA